MSKAGKITTANNKATDFTRVSKRKDFVLNIHIPVCTILKFSCQHGLLLHTTSINVRFKLKLVRGCDSHTLFQVTFYPDLAKFAMTRLERDTVALMKRRAYDVAATTPGVTVSS